MLPVNPYLKKKSVSSEPVDDSKVEGVKNAQSIIQGGSNVSNIKAPTLNSSNIKINANAKDKQVAPKDISSTVLKQSVTPSPSMKLPLKEQLKYEIALLQKQKKERILAKKQAKEQAALNKQVDKTGDVNFAHSIITPVNQRTQCIQIKSQVITENKTLIQPGDTAVPVSNAKSFQIAHPLQTGPSLVVQHVPFYVPPLQSSPIQAHLNPMMTHYSKGVFFPTMKYPVGFMPFYHSVNNITQKVDVPTISKASPSMPLHTNPLDSSCFGKTHSRVNHKIMIVKKEGESFGINLKYETKTISKSNQTCGILMVTNASTQNMRAQPGTSQAHLLQKGDIIMSVDSVEVHGLEFREATGLFAKVQPISSSSSNEGVSTVAEYRCELTVARDKKRSKVLSRLCDLSLDTSKSLSIQGTIGPVVPKVPYIITTDGQTLVGTDFDSTEVHALLTGLIEYKGEMYEDVFSDILSKPFVIKSLRRRTVSDCNKKWHHMVTKIESEMSQNAIAHWKSLWNEECNDEDDMKYQRNYVSDSERCYLRHRPRPVGGCKCGSKEHQYVNHPSCFLYRNLRKLMNDSDEIMDEQVTTGAAKIAKYDSLLKNKTLNSIGNAHVQRMMSRLEEQEAERIEAAFVNKMEILQVKSGVAVFSPKHKVVMLLSAIAAFQESGIIPSNIDQQSAERTGNKTSDSDDESDDEDDIPLTAVLGKRPIESRSDGSFAKRLKFDKRKPSFDSLAFILNYISHTWGHLFRDLSPVENAWAKHCIIKGYSDSSFSPEKTNKSDESGFVFENAKFILPNISKDRAVSDKEKFAIVYLLSDDKTGLLREIYDIINIGLIEIDDNNALRLANDWEEKIPPFILFDMVEEGWSSDVDTSNKFFIHPTIKNKIDSKWKRSSVGWEMTCFDKTIHFVEEDFNRLRQRFMDKFEDYEATGAGVQQFGV